MYDKLFTYFTQNKRIFENKFWFTAGHSTNHALLELIYQLCECFDEKRNILLYTVHHEILIRKSMQYVAKKVIFQTKNNKLHTKVVLTNRNQQIWCKVYLNACILNI